MAPMHGARVRRQGKEKRRNPGLAPDEDLYTEDRPWTEAVLGQSPRVKDVQDGKDASDRGDAPGGGRRVAAGAAARRRSWMSSCTG